MSLAEHGISFSYELFVLQRTVFAACKEDLSSPEGTETPTVGEHDSSMARSAGQARAPSPR